MNMYNDQRQKIGTKSTVVGAGQQREDGSRGNLVTMNFAPPPQTQPQQQPQQVATNNPNNGYMQAPQVSLQTPQDNPNLSRIISNIATLKNASRQQDYDKMNATLYDNAQNRAQNQNQFITGLAERQRQYNQTFDMQNQQFERTHDLNMQKQQQQYGTPSTSDMTARSKLFDDMAQGHYGDSYGDYDTDTIAQAKNYYIQNGKFPTINPVVDDGLLWDSTSYKVGNDNVTGSQAPQQHQKDAPNSDEAERFKRWKAIKEARAKHEAILNNNQNYNKNGYSSDML